MPDLDGLLAFTRFTHQTHRVERVARIPGMDRYANTVEHSFQLTLLAWFLIEKEHLPLDKDLVIKYALVHDLVETYAGDTYLYDTTRQHDKKQREHEALLRIQGEFPDFADLTTLIARYEVREDAEAHFVYALDKLVDPLNIFLENGKLWHERGVTLPQLLAYKAGKVTQDPTVGSYFEALVARLQEHEAKLFPDTPIDG